MEETRTGAKEKKQYEYREYPRNVRQIGVPLPGRKVYLEDYVITYLKQCFVCTSESKIVILLGKNGEEKVEEGIFVYGAIALEEEKFLEEGTIGKAVWDKVYETIHKNFSGARVLGWACGVSVWNSQTDHQVRKLQKEEFAKENQVLFLWDLSEKEEKIFLWQHKMLKEMSGYYVYFEKNPQMQEFMLDKPETESVESNYQDTVTRTMRHVMEEKDERRKNLQMLSYCGAIAAGVALVFGVHMMLDSTTRIKKMEKTVSTLSEYVGSQQETMEVLSSETENKVTDIPFENQSTSEPSATTGKKEKRKKNSEKKKTENTSAKEDSQSQETEETSVASKQQTQSYLVKKGDTLSQIVWRQYHDLSYEKKVKEVNGLKNADEIYEGQCLILPKYK
jgi:nucleoid-associated protein YgaU